MRVLMIIALAAATLVAPASFGDEVRIGSPIDPAFIRDYYHMNRWNNSAKSNYRGPLGNEEEPALRPYKWMYHGIKSLFYHTGDQFVEGNLHAPGVGSVQGLRGVRRGTMSLGESTYRGLVFAPVPSRTHYKSLGALNEAIESDMLTRNSSDFLFSWYFFPVQKAIDNNPPEGDTKVAIRQKEAKETRQARDEATRARKKVDARESSMESAQRDYIGARADYGTPKTKMGRGNLMKLGR